MNSFGGIWDDNKCFEFEMANNIRLDNDGFVNLYINTAQQISELVEFETFADIGGGVGAYSIAMKNRNKQINYYDLNSNHLEYAKKHNVAHNYFQCDITDTKIKVDLVACIEVMEHITDDKLNRMLENIECNYFHFSSTPHLTDFDAEWGHINIKQESQWIELFNNHNYELMKKVNVPTTWSLLFKKTID